jgi:hypothetical protein
VQEDQAEQRRLNGLGLDVGDGDDERAVAHRGEHQRGRDDLGPCAKQHPRPEFRRRRGKRLAGHRKHHDKKHDRERKSEQKAHMRRADRAERGGELALHGVARGLACGGQQRERNPEQA